MALDVDVREAYRYLGLRGRAPDAATERAVDEALRALQDEIDPKRVARRFDLARPEDGVLEIEGLRVQSRALYRHLDGCGEVYLMAATLGIGPDRLIARAQAAGSMHRAVTLQAAAAAMIEALCDRVNDELRALAAARGEGLR
ncbi:MAG: Vitamin B12 dependent methionine synthase activation subunit, partial [Clostridia bacterium]|nr:Vitamin B12 dependent methionine synthase activation subunit [Clostridia bacterium]